MRSAGAGPGLCEAPSVPVNLCAWVVLEGRVQAMEAGVRRALCPPPPRVVGYRLARASCIPRSMLPVGAGGVMP